MGNQHTTTIDVTKELANSCDQLPSDRLLEVFIHTVIPDDDNQEDDGKDGGGENTQVITIRCERQLQKCMPTKSVPKVPESDRTVCHTWTPNTKMRDFEGWIHSRQRKSKSHAVKELVSSSSNAWANTSSCTVMKKSHMDSIKYLPFGIHQPKRTAFSRTTCHLATMSWLCADRMRNKSSDCVMDRTVQTRNQSFGYLVSRNPWLNTSQRKTQTTEKRQQQKRMTRGMMMLTANQTRATMKRKGESNLQATSINEVFLVLCI